MKKIFLLMFMCMFLCSFVNATTIFFGGDYMIAQEQDTCFNIPLTCDNCTYMNITIAYPNGTVVIENQVMSSIGGYVYNYTFCNTSTLGDYWIFSHYDEDGSYIYTDGNFFRVTPTGFNITFGGSVLYIGILFILLFLFIISLIGIFKVEHYIGKFALYWTTHLLFVIWTFSVWKITDGFLYGFIGLAGIFKILFWVSITAMFPMVLLSLAWIFYIHTVNDDMKKMMERGMDEDEAYARAKEKRRRKK